MEQPNVKDAGTQTPATRIEQESSKSMDKSSDAAISAIYEVFSKYNGIIRQVIEMTTPDGGKWSTRKTVDNSTVMYFASVIKGLIEPLKHMIFQLSQVHDGNLASMLNMVVSLVKIIDQSPPFKMVDINAYKNGIPDYEGLSDDLSLADNGAYVQLLQMRADSLNQKIKTSASSVRATLSNIPANMRDSVRKTAEDAIKQAKDALAAITKEIEKAKKKVAAGLNTVIVNARAVGDVETAEEALQVMFDYDESSGSFSAPQSGVYDIDTGVFHSTIPAGYAMDSAGNVVKTGSGAGESSELKRLQQQQKNIEAVYPEAKDSSGEFDGQLLPAGDKEQYLAIISRIARLSRKSGSGSSGSCGSGAGKTPVDNKQQYNSMGRPLSNDQKINNDMINANRNWQVKNNPPHDTPLGNLNPFLAQEAAAKYTYEVKLAQENNILHPERNALGADISLLQGPIGNISGSGKPSKAMMKLKKVAIDEKNDMYAPTEIGTDGYIPEDQENQFKLPDLKPKKKK